MSIATEALIDGAALGAELTALAGGRKGTLSAADRAAIVSRLKRALAEGRAEAERQLSADGRGDACARRLSDLQDAIIRAIHDFAVENVYPSDNPTASERMAIVAVGGYGRGTLAPGSDVDLLFLLPYKQTPWGESVVEFILYVLWDLGLKVGHATRSVTECIRLSRSDMTIRTAILEARYIWGDKALFDELVTRFDTEVVKGTGPEFIAAKLAERDARHRQQGASRYLVEPNVKDGKGGLRDLHTLFWIAKYFYRVQLARGAGQGRRLLRAPSSPRFRKSEDFLWAVRCHLHFLTGRAEERLSFDLQREMAVRLGYTAHPGLKDVERFMKHYFLVAKEVGDLTRIFCAALEEHHGKPVPALNRFFGLGRKRRPQDPRHDRFRRRERPHQQSPTTRSSRATRSTSSASSTSPTATTSHFHPDAMQLVTRSLGLIDGTLRDDPEANRLFLEILSSRKQPELVLRAHERDRRARPLHPRLRQDRRDDAVQHVPPLHRRRAPDPLDRHPRRDRARRGGGRAPAGERDLPRHQGPRRPLCRALPARHRQGPAGGPFDRRRAASPASSARASASTPAQTETVAWLVEHHLLMSMTAQSRDLNDRKTILDFAAVVQSLERMKMLLILTVADIKAVGPGVWNGWKGQLLRTLYYETEPVLTGGHSQVSRDRRVAAAQGGAGRGARRLAGERARRLSRAPLPGLLAARRPAAQDRPCRLHPRGRAASKRALATAIRTRAFEAVTEITVFAPDHPRLLSIIAGACTIAGANIVDAQIYTTTDGQALDSISIRREFDDEADEERRARKVGDLIEQALAGVAPHPRAGRAAGPGRSRASRPSALETQHQRRQFAVEPLHRDRGLRPRPARAFSTTSPGRSPTSTSTSPRPISRPSASARSTSST